MKKICAGCQIKKDVSEFSLTSRGKPKSRCKPCRAAQARDEYQKNPEHFRQRVNDWQTRNAPKRNARRRAKYHENPERARKQRREWRSQNLEHCRARDRAKYHQNPERIRERGRKDYQKNKDRYLETAKKYRQSAECRARERARARTETRKAYMRALYHKDVEHSRSLKRQSNERCKEHRIPWAKTHRERYNELALQTQRRRRARKAGAPIVEKVDRLTVLERDDYTCHLCHRRFEANNLQLDHVVPLSRGGTETYDNIKAACGGCNRKKGARLLSELSLGDFLPEGVKQ